MAAPVARRCHPLSRETKICVFFAEKLLSGQCPHIYLWRYFQPSSGNAFVRTAVKSFSALEIDRLVKAEMYRTLNHAAKAARGFRTPLFCVRSALAPLVAQAEEVGGYTNYGDAVPQPFCPSKQWIQ
jgi:hypothetical protein